MDAGKPVRLDCLSTKVQSWGKEKKTGGAVGLFKYQKGRQGASSKRANRVMWLQVHQVPPQLTTVFHLGNLPAIWGNLRQFAGKLPAVCLCRNITPPFSKACPQALYVCIILLGHSCLYVPLVAYYLYYTSILSILLNTLAVQVYLGNGCGTPITFADYL